MQISIVKEKALVFVGTIGAAASGYLLALNRPAEASLVGAVTAAIVVFWSQGVNTAPASTTA